jgi:hypothetical protein
MSEGDGAAPIPVVAASALLWIQGAIWGTLGALVVAYDSGTSAGGWLIGVFFGFTVLSGSLAVLLPRPGSARSRTGVIALECFMTLLSLVVSAAALLDPFLAWIAVFLGLPGALVASCAVGGLLTAQARGYCQSRVVPR